MNQDESEQSLNFDQDPQYANLPPLDKMRKVRREVLRTINELRGKYPNSIPLNYDEYANYAAEEYANFLLTERENNA